MSYSTLIIGESGTGKTCSLRNLPPEKTLLIQPMRKPLPFRAKGWHEVQKKGDGGNIFVTANPAQIINAMDRTDKEIIVLDDFQYVLISMEMAARSVNGYEKYNRIGEAGYDIAMVSTQLDPFKRVYIFGHTQKDEFGRENIKTIGRMLDRKITFEGMFTTVLGTLVNDSGYFFRTQNGGNDTIKSPMDMFPERLIENDLLKVDKIICDFYGIESQLYTKENNNAD